ncbi:MAG: hypothetical protein ACFFCW_31040 [Candidatus Hodarchaeota archaeon]
MTSSSTNIKEIRKFGLISFLFFSVLCALGFWRGKVVLTYFFALLSLLGIGLLLLPAPLGPIYKIWLKVAYSIGRIITTLILTLAYYLVITPSALIKHLFGGPPLPIRHDKGASSYWVARTEPIQPKKRFSKRY